MAEKSRKEQIKEIKEIIEVATLAIPREREAQARYLKASRQAPGDLSRRLFERLAKDEQQHEAKLKAIVEHMKEKLRELNS